MAQSIQRLDLDNQQLSLAVDNELTISKGNTIQLPFVTSIADLQSFPNNIALFDGSTWEKKTGDVQSNGGGFPGTLIRVNSTTYWERKTEGKNNVIWFGAKGDGVTNNYDYITNAINASNSELFIPNGNYVLSQRLNITKNDFVLKGDYNTNLIVSGQNVIELGNCNNIKIENIKFFSTLNTTTCDLMGLLFADKKQLNNISIINCNFTCENVPQNGIKIITDQIGSYVENLKIEKCKFENLGRMGIEIQNNLSDGVYRINNTTITDCVFRNLGLKSGTSGNGVEHYGMAVSFGGLGRNNNTINNIIDNPYDIGIEYAGGAGFYSTISNNVFENITRVTTELSNQNLFILSVTWSGNTSTGIRNLLITKNYCISNTSVAACRFENLFYANISENDFNLKKEITFTRMLYSTISNNSFVSRTGYSIYTTSGNSFFPVAYNNFYNNTFDILAATGQVSVVVFEAQSHTNIIKGGWMRRAGDGNIMLNFSTAYNNKMEDVNINSLTQSSLFTIAITDANKTLEEFQCQSNIIEITGTTTTSRILYLPLTNRKITIKNLTNNTLEIRLKDQTVTGINLLSGETKNYVVEISKTSNNWLNY